jgi:hypothetical protein
MRYSRELLESHGVTMEKMKCQPSGNQLLLTSPRDSAREKTIMGQILRVLCYGDGLDVLRFSFFGTKEM